MSVQVKLSTLWIVVMFNMVFADILSFLTPGFLDEVRTGVVDGIAITPWFVLLAAILIELPILMIFLSKYLARKPNRALNLIVAAVTIMFVVAGGSLTPHYIFMAGIEVIAMIYICYLAWNWTPEGEND